MLHRLVLTTSLLAALAWTGALSAQSSEPTAPRNFVASLAGSTVTLEWDPPLEGEPITNYLLDFGFESGVYVATAPLGEARSFSITLPPGNYFFRLSAENDVGIGPPTMELRVRVGATTLPLSAPRNLTAAIVNARIHLAWDPPATSGAPIRTYLLRVGTAPGASDVLVGTVGPVPVTSVEAPVSVLPPGTYYIRVSALVDEFESPPSNEVMLAIGATDPPGQPKIIAVDVVNFVLLTLRWTAPTDGGPVTGYVLSFGSGPGLSDLGVVPVGNTTSFQRVVTNLPPGRYYLRVRAENPQGEGPPSEESSFVVGNPNLPGAPRDLTLVIASGNVTLRWTEPTTGSPITDYRVYLGLTPTTINLGGVRTGGATSYQIPLASLSGGTFYFRVSAVNAQGEGPSSNVASFTLDRSVPPGPPQNLTAQIANGLLTVGWTEPVLGAPFTGYVLQVGSAAGVYDVGTLALPATTRVFQFGLAGIAPGTYYFRVTALNQFGNGTPSVEISVDVAPP